MSPPSSSPLSKFFYPLVAFVSEPILPISPNRSSLATRFRSESESLPEFRSDSGVSSASSSSANGNFPAAHQVARGSAENRTSLGRSTRPAWLSALWRTYGAAITPVQSQRTDETELQQERHDRCAIHSTRTATSKKVTDDMVQAVEHALSKAYGTDIPPHIAQIVGSMKRDAEQCALAFDWLAPFGHAPLADTLSQRAISAADLAYATQSAQRATNAAIACSQRLFALAKMTDASRPIDVHEPTHPAANHPIDIRKINASLAVIGSDQFQHILVAGLTLEQRLQRGMQQAGAALQHVAGEAVEWLLPTLKTEQPEIYAQKIAMLLPKARNTAAIEWVARPRFEETERCLHRSWFNAPQPPDETSHAEYTTFRQLLVHLRDQSNSLHQQISNAAELTSRLAMHDAANWRNQSQAERDVATATTQQHHAKQALPQLEALLAQVKTLPNAMGGISGMSGTNGSINMTE